MQVSVIQGIRCMQETCMSAMPFDRLLIAVPVGLRSLLSQRHHCRSTGCMLQRHCSSLLFILIRPALPSMALPQALSIARRLASAMGCAVALGMTLACAGTLLRCAPLCCAGMGEKSRVSIRHRLHGCMAAGGAQLSLLLLLLVVVLLGEALHSLSECNRLQSRVRLRAGRACTG